MEWPLLTAPSWSERQGKGPQLTYPDIAALVADGEGSRALEWRHVHVIATLWAESGFYAWARPLVWAPDRKHHLSVDRGICAFNSHPDYWGWVDDVIAYDPELAVPLMIRWLKSNALEGVKGAKAWDWRPLLDWQWHGYGTDRYEQALAPSRDVVNKVRASAGLSPV